jgi:hypothetical protein
VKAYIKHLDPDKEKPCSETNPALWAAFCCLHLRDPLAQNPVWTEADTLNWFADVGEQAAVAQAMVLKGMVGGGSVN